MVKYEALDKQYIYGGSRVTGVPPGLQNLCWALGASWVGSIPTRVRQKLVTFT